MISLPQPVIGCMKRRVPDAAALLAGLILAVISITACEPPHSEPPPPEPQISWQPPAFELEDSDGKLLRYPQDLGGPTIVFFWASWCPYCKSLMPHLQSIIDEYGGGIEVLALNFREDEDPAEFLAERGYDFRLFENSDPVAERWGIRATPGLFLVDQSGLALFSNYAVPEDAFRTDPADEGRQLKHYQRAARRAPVWAAALRQAIDQLQP
jgi:thiol-disulfide isomerase/thioredoxin